MKLLIANWKLNPPTAKGALDLAMSAAKAAGARSAKRKVILCPPFVYISEISRALGKKSKVGLGSQDIFWEDRGPFTGQISGPMLKSLGAKYAIIGHSEQRALGESDGQISAKIKAALHSGITPILCVGYGTESHMAEEDVLMHIKGQVEEDLQGADPSKIIVAYEPVWAIGTGKPATPEHAERVAMFMRIKFKIKKALYGGSANASNAGAFLGKEIDGLLVGGASLDKNDFIKMIS